MSLRLLSALFLCLLTGLAGAVPLRLCQDVRGHLPLEGPDGTGVLDRLLREAAREAGIELQVYAAPVARCREEMRAGLADAYPLAPFSAELTGYMIYPEKQGQPDAARALLTTRVVAVRRLHGPQQWDGKHFSQLDGPVLAMAGTLTPGAVARAHGLPFDNAAPSVEQNLEKLLAGRGSLFLVVEPHVLPFMARPQFAGKLEIIDKPVVEQRMYIALTRRFYARYPQQAEHFWAAAARLAHGPQYREALAEALRASRND
ncbi:hypothetical protein [Massilia sp. TS11]|uniref:hypothetical protein n=1 Tax=Massilia sp. TS11 TaxID=2908003 RepID=UPI001EDC693C|nr:hypothetical protein [Massilia sp. TS11]MCG2586253.1 hypothetical protein [Massilia sp. TS11]